MEEKTTIKMGEMYDEKKGNEGKKLFIQTQATILRGILVSII